MSGPLSWWANRKSRMGLKPSAKKPPHAPGKEWWTDPPTAAPLPEHMEYAATFMANLLTMPPSAERHAMQAYIGKWLRTAQSLLSSQMYSVNIEDSHTIEGVLMAAQSAVYDLIGKLRDAGGEPTERHLDVLKLLTDRTRKVRRDRASARVRRGATAPSR
jgi:hypothetical protein